MRSSTKLGCFYLGIIIVVLVMHSIASCTTTKKVKWEENTSIKASTANKIDSSSLKTESSAQVKKDNTVTTVEKEDDYEKETVIEFGEGLTKTAIDSAIASGKPFSTILITSDGSLAIPAEDYFQPIRKITIKEKGTRKEKSTTEANTYDSTSKSSKEQVWLVVTTKMQVVTKTNIKKKDVVTSGPTFWQKIKRFFVLIVIAAVIFVGWYFKIWSRLWLWWLMIWNRLKKKKA